MSEKLGFTIEVAGCPTVCGHCWARGRGYKAMPLDDIAWILKGANRVCSEVEIPFDAYPLHEVLAHPDAGDMLRLFNEAGNAKFEPIPTTGVPLATRKDWRVLMEAIGKLGTTTLWFTFHGVEEVHDRAVHRPGAFRETCTAVERVHSTGLRCGCNIILTKENIPQHDRLVETLQSLSMDEVFWWVADYYPTTRLRQHEPLRPELDDLLPLAERIQELTPSFMRSRWDDLESRTEAAFVQRALESSEDNEQAWIPFADRQPNLALVCRPNFDLHSGFAGTYGINHGNLKSDGIEQVVRNALEHGPQLADSIYFDTDAIPPISDVARAMGDPKGQKVYFFAPAMRWRWLDMALTEYRRF